MIWFITAASGGSGVSTLAASLAIRAAEQGRETLLLDASGASHVCDAYLGVEDLVLTAEDLFSGEASIHSIQYATSWAHLRYALLSTQSTMTLSEVPQVLSDLHKGYEVLIVDAGVCATPPEFEGLHASDHLVVLARPDSLSLRSAQALLRAVQPESYETHWILNLAPEYGRKDLQRLTEEAESAIGMRPDRIITLVQSKKKSSLSGVPSIPDPVRRAACDLAEQWCLPA